MKYYRRIPLFIRIIECAIIGGFLGNFLKQDAESLKPVSDIVLQLLRLLATPLIFFSIVHAILTREIPGAKAGRLLWVLMSNTLMATLIGLLVADALAPGLRVKLTIPSGTLDAKPFNPVHDLLGKIPKDLVAPFASNEVIGIIIVAIALAVTLKALKVGEHQARIKAIEGYAKLGLDVTLKLLHWLFELIPLAVLAVVAQVVGKTGFQPLFNMLWFVNDVIAALCLTFAFYLWRVGWSSWVGPVTYAKKGLDAFVMAFSTASSLATLPLTYECATEKIGIGEESASLGIMVGGTFNHDGSALFQAMAAIFVSQAVGVHLELWQQALVVGMAVVAAVTVAGIPEAGLVTMIAVFTAVRLPIEAIPLLLPIDWLLDRCRTTINVAGNLAATCILDGKRPAPNGIGR